MSAIKIKWGFPQMLYGIFSALTAVVGHSIHGSIFWTLVDFIFPVIAWAKWLICHEVNLTILRSTFSFFLS